MNSAMDFPHYMVCYRLSVELLIIKVVSGQFPILINVTENKNLLFLKLRSTLLSSIIDG